MVEKLDRESATPLYIQLADVIRAKIQRGDWQPDQRIPSENELNQLYGISRMTARQVLARLVDEGLLFRVQGKGTFVSRRKISTRSPSYQGIREQLEQQGYATSTELLGQRLEPASARVAQALDVAVGTPTYIVRRLRRVDGTPISVHESHVPEALAPGVLERDLVAEQLCTVLDRDFGLRMTKVLETLETTAASSGDAKLLAVHEGTPILQLEQRIAAPSGKAFEFSRIRFRGDMVRLEFSYDL